MEDLFKGGGDAVEDAQKQGDAAEGGAAVGRGGASGGDADPGAGGPAGGSNLAPVEATQPTTTTTPAGEGTDAPEAPSAQQPAPQGAPASTAEPPPAVEAPPTDPLACSRAQYEDGVLELLVQRCAELCWGESAGEGVPEALVSSVTMKKWAPGAGDDDLGDGDGRSCWSGFLTDAVVTCCGYYTHGT